MFVLGITGGIGSGKSEVTGYFRDYLDASVCLADGIGAKLQAKDGPAYAPIVSAFGKDILCENGCLDRKKLASVVFNDAEQLKILDDIVHPLVENYIQNEMARSRTEGKKIFVVESAILIEVGYKQFCDEVWFVKAPKRIRIKRLKETRDMTESQALAVMSRQLSDEEYEKKCDYTIKNNADLETLFKRIEKRLRELNLLED
ncbi:MAG: dephospho-CoA kinase [Lachnospiraceae bacterium]|nr:dephospho-CoA kinase [Lachnospiraceae bacterium]